MITSEKVKQFLREHCKAEVVGIASARPFSAEERQRVTDTLTRIGNANPTMSNTAVYDPEDFVDGARAVVVFGKNSYFGADPYGGNDRSGSPHGAIGNFYLNQNILNRAMQHSSLFKSFMEAEGFKAESPFAGFPQKIKALEAGVGIRGKNTLILNRTLGSWFSLSTMITDAPLEPDEPLRGDCGTCTRCMDACPTGALDSPYSIKVERCIIYNLCHLKEDIPLALREKMGVRIGDCTACSDACPYNKALAVNEDDRLPDDVIYPLIAPLMNMSEEEYEARYGSQFFGFIIGGRRYLRRNTAVALGNAQCARAVPELERAAGDDDPLVSSHAAWALEKINGKGGGRT